MKLNIQTADERSVVFEQELNAIFVINFKFGRNSTESFGQPCVIFRRVRKIAKSYYWLRGVCLSVRPHGTTLFSLDGFS